MRHCVHTSALPLQNVWRNRGTVKEIEVQQSSNTVLLCSLFVLTRRTHAFYMMFEWMLEYNLNATNYEVSFIFNNNEMFGYLLKHKNEFHIKLSGKRQNLFLWRLFTFLIVLKWKYIYGRYYHSNVKLYHRYWNSIFTFSDSSEVSHNRTVKTAKRRKFTAGEKINGACIQNCYDFFSRVRNISIIKLFFLYKYSLLLLWIVIHYINRNIYTLTKWIFDFILMTTHG